MTRPETLENIHNEWLPLIVEAAGQTKPVIVAGNKKDLLFDGEDPQESYITGLLGEFSFVKYCCRCSARMTDVDNVFYYADVAVNYPVDPLYDVATTEFTPECIRAFKRVFRMYDCDRDGLLSDHELSTLQEKAFGTEGFADDELIDLKKHIAHIPNALVDAKISFVGFMGIIRMFIEGDTMVMETPWLILRNNGFEDDDLSLDVDSSAFSCKSDADRDKAAARGCFLSSQLSERAIRFVYDIAVLSVRIVSNSSSSGGGAHAHGYGDGARLVVTDDAIEEIFSVLPPDVYHPWRSMMKEEARAR